MSNPYAISMNRAIGAWCQLCRPLLQNRSTLVLNQRLSPILGIGIMVFQLFCLPIYAQVPPANIEYDQDIAQFKDKQEKISRLFTKQQQRLVKLNERIAENKQQLNKLVELLKYPKNVPKHKDEALTQLVEIRKRNDDDKQMLQEMYFEWLKFEIDITSIYARYGELNLIQKVDTDLKAFLQLHRTLVQEMSNAMGNIKFIYNEADYLLSAKLE